MSEAPSVVPFGELPRLARLTVLGLGAAALALAVRLWPEWRHNPDLSHGLFMPIVFALLIHEARLAPGRFLATTRGLNVAWGLLIAAAIAALIAAGLYAAAVDWSHPLVDLSLTASWIGVAAAGLLVLSNRVVRFVPWNWTAIVAIVLWCLCTPIPPGTYSRLTLALQLWVTEAVDVSRLLKHGCTLATKAVGRFTRQGNPIA